MAKNVWYWASTCELEIDFGLSLSADFWRCNWFLESILRLEKDLWCRASSFVDDAIEQWCARLHGDGQNLLKVTRMWL